MGAEELATVNATRQTDQNHGQLIINILMRTTMMMMIMLLLMMMMMMMSASQGVAQLENGSNMWQTRPAAKYGQLLLYNNWKSEKTNQTKMLASRCCGNVQHCNMPIMLHFVASATSAVVVSSKSEVLFSVCRRLAASTRLVFELDSGWVGGLICFFFFLAAVEFPLLLQHIRKVAGRWLIESSHKIQVEPTTCNKELQFTIAAWHWTHYARTQGRRTWVCVCVCATIWEELALAELVAALMLVT